MAKSDVLGAVGLISGLIIDLRKRVIENGGTDEDMLFLGKPSGQETLNRIASLVIEDRKVSVESVKLGSLLSLYNDVKVPASSKLTFLWERYWEASQKQKLTFSGLDENFMEWFDGKKEEERPADVLNCYSLNRDASDIQMITRLGGEEKCETTLSHVWSLFELCEDGKYRLYEYNIFFVRDIRDRLRVILAERFDGYWRMWADPIGGRASKYHRDFRVFVPKS